MELAKRAAGTSCRVAGSIAPLADCYRPDLSPALERPDETYRAHAQMAEALADGVDLLLCETFASIDEAVLAARAAVEKGVSALLVSCTPAAECERYVAALASVGVPTGVYANAGVSDDETGFRSDPKSSPERYSLFAERWTDAGAVIIGGCCGTRPAHIKALHQNQ